MTRPHRRAVLTVVAATVGFTGAATAQQTPAPSTTPTTTSPATTAPAAPVGPPRLSNLKLPDIVTAQQGHARFLVGVRTATPAKLVLQLTAVKGDVLVKTVQSTAVEKAGRVYFLVDATNTQRYQLPVGRYRVRLVATDAAGRQSQPVQKVFTLKLTTPRGRLDAHLVNLTTALARSVGAPGRTGQLVGAVAPGGAMAKAGLRRGDIITSINGDSTTSAGALSAALRALPADTAVPVVFRRAGDEQTVQLKVPADWNPAPDLTKVYVVVAKRDPKSMAYAVARAAYLIDQGKVDVVQGLIDAWPATWRQGAPGQATQAQLFERAGQAKKALGAWNRALLRDPRMAAAQFGRGIALNSLGKDAQAAAAFGEAFRLDNRDASAAAFQAFSLIRANQTAAARAPALAADAADPTSPDAKVAAGIALIQNGNPARGVVKLREGLLLTDDPTRAQSIIDQYLEAADK